MTVEDRIAYVIVQPEDNVISRKIKADKNLKLNIEKTAVKTLVIVTSYRELFIDKI